jgi:hypothetical protein
MVIRASIGIGIGEGGVRGVYAELSGVGGIRRIHHRGRGGRREEEGGSEGAWRFRVLGFLENALGYGLGGECFGMGEFEFKPRDLGSNRGYRVALME